MAAAAFFDRILESSTTTGTGTLTLAGAVAGYQTFGAVGNANTTPMAIWEVDANGNPSGAWETAADCTFTSSGTTLTRGTFLASSTGSAVSFAAGTKRVAQVLPAAILNQLILMMVASPPGGRLGLTTGNPTLTAPQVGIAASGQDTSADTVTLTAHPFVVGSLVKSGTSGGLTAATQYFAGNITANTISFHTTLAAAIAGTSKVDITGTVTTTITTAGLQSKTLFWTPYKHALIRVWNGLRWEVKTFAESSLALTLTTGKNYDVFIDDDAATLSLSAAWTSDNVRADALGTQDGVVVLDSDHTKLWLGTIRAITTGTVEDSVENRHLWNCYNPLRRRTLSNFSTSHTINNQVAREWNAGTNAIRTTFVVGEIADSVNMIMEGQIGALTTAGPYAILGIGLNSTTAFQGSILYHPPPHTSGGNDTKASSGAWLTPLLGYNFVTVIEQEAGSFNVDMTAASLRGMVPC